MSYPVYLSSFVGRKNELGEIKSLMREKSTRLVTLTGSGGSGKTRLAYEAITQLASAFEDGLVWVELVGLADPLAVPQAVASALEMNTAPGQTVLQALTAFLQHREALIVLDNCEHLIQACSGLVDGLLRACPALHILATSRQRLAVEGEQVWPVPPLAYPTTDALPLDALTRYDALQLFAARARQARP
jgi:predicted ATPase